MTVSFVEPLWAVGSSWAANAVDTNGTRWVCNSDNGWFDPLGVRSSDQDNPSADGSYSGTDYRTARIITLGGYAKSLTEALADQAADQFAALLSIPDTLAVTKSGRTLQALVKLGGNSQLARTSPRGFEWQLVMVADDPRKYDAATVTAATTLAIAGSGLDWTGGGVGGLDWTGGATGGLVWGTGGSDGTCVIANAGTASSPPTFTIAGPTDAGTLTNPSITNTATGQIISYAGILNVGDVLVIDSHTTSRSAILNGGTDVWSGLTISQWFDVPARGQAKVQFQGTTSSLTPRLTVGVSNAYY